MAGAFAGERGQHALIGRGAVEDSSDTYADAITIGYKISGLEPFLVTQVVQFEQSVVVTRVLVPPVS